MIIEFTEKEVNDLKWSVKKALKQNNVRLIDFKPLLSEKGIEVFANRSVLLHGILAKLRGG